MMTEELKRQVISMWKVKRISHTDQNERDDLLVCLEPQWRFETKLPATLEADENDKIELECTVQDEDAECDWFFAGEVSQCPRS